ncbi:hypothetical protein TNCV_3798451 [Trichonephila clavipes]|nr:hypothetical protein TNCV_3798451 [Trichonephila clavipes]
MTQERYSDLAIISIESENSEKIDLTETINKIVSQKARKGPVQYEFVVDLSGDSRVQWSDETATALRHGHMGRFSSTRSSKET